MLEQTISWLSIIKGAISITVLIGGVYGIIVAIRKERAKFATMEYVKRENKRLEKQTALMIDSVKESQEEYKTLLETMASQIKFIYEKHYTP
jgi:hypothetical protein